MRADPSYWPLVFAEAKRKHYLESFERARLQPCRTSHTKEVGL
jgi:hypothetical protein